MDIKIVNINRASGDNKQTLGTLNTMRGTGTFICKTLELGWQDNASNISCIPKGTYTAKWTRSNRLSAEAGHDVFTYEILGVPNRAGIRIHSANYFFQLKGCIALGKDNTDLNKDGLMDITESKNTVNKFNELMNKEDFKLIIT